MIDVAIVEDSWEYRETLKLLINGTPKFKCNQSFENAEKALAEINKQVPDIILVDIGLPGMSGIEFIKRTKQQYSQIQFLVLTISDEDDKVFDALRAGASGYLLKSTEPADILKSIGELYDGGAPMSASIARKNCKFFQQ